MHSRETAMDMASRSCAPDRSEWSCGYFSINYQVGRPRSGIGIGMKGMRFLERLSVFETKFIISRGSPAAAQRTYIHPRLYMYTHSKFAALSVFNCTQISSDPESLIEATTL